MPKKAKKKVGKKGGKKGKKVTKLAIPKDDGEKKSVKVDDGPHTPTAADLAALEEEATQEMLKKKLMIDKSHDVGHISTLKMERCEELVKSGLVEETNPGDEKKVIVLEYVDSFRKQFLSIYPERRPPLLTPWNEFALPKFVCSTITPTQLPYKELYDYKLAAKFIADYLTYEPLEPSHLPPSIIPSPARIARWQRGDSFDMAMLLASILLGSGYDAYVVSGFVTKDFALRDMRKITCPFLEVEKDVIKEVSSEDAQESPYSMTSKLDLSSKFIASQEKKKSDKVVEELKQAEELLDESIDEEEIPKDEPRPFCHAWVLILAGKREVEENIYVDAVSGRVTSTTDDHFVSVEAIWNHKNYWINMQYDQSGVAIDGPVNFDLTSTSLWEYVIPTSATTEKAVMDGDVPPVQEEKEDDGEQLDLPPPWGQKIEISRERFESRRPKGIRETLWYKCRTEQYAPYTRDDGMVLKIIKYKDKLCSRVEWIKELYEHRRDRLSTILRTPQGDEQAVVSEQHWIVDEMFLPGRRHHLKLRKLVDGVVKEMHYYTQARIDGLSKRIIIHEKNKAVEYFEGRDDFLCFRSAVYDLQAAKQSDAAVGAIGVPIAKMTEKFLRNPAKPAKDDIMKCTYVIGVRIKVVFHRSDGNITHSSIIFNRDGTSHVTLVDPFAPKLNAEDLFNQFTQLLESEKKCANLIRQNDKEAADINEMRQIEDDNIELTVSVYDTERNKSRTGGLDAKEEEAAARKMEHTYLSPFLMEIGGQAPETEEQALKVYDACVTALKQGLVQKEQLILARRDELINARDRRMTAYQRNLEHPDPEEDKAHDVFLAECEFKIRILDERLARHREMAFKRDIDLHEKIIADPLMQKLHVADMEERLNKIKVDYARKLQQQLAFQ